MLKIYFQNELAKLGYSNEMVIEYSLSYSQGDGMAFYGKQNTGNICELVERLLISGQDTQNAFARVSRLMRKQDVNCMLRVIRESEMGYLSIHRNSLGNHYSHWNTMTVDHEIDFSFLLEEQNSSIVENETGILLDQETVDRWKGYWDEFIELLQGDVRETSKRLECHGYAMTDAVNCEDKVTWEKRTQNFTVTIRELSTSLEDFFDMGDYDVENVIELSSMLLEGKHRVVTVEAVVVHNDTGNVFGCHQYDALLVEAEDLTYGKVRKDILAQAIYEAREHIESLSGLLKKKAA